VLARKEKGKAPSLLSGMPPNGLSAFAGIAPAGIGSFIAAQLLEAAEIDPAEQGRARSSASRGANSWRADLDFIAGSRPFETGTFDWPDEDLASAAHRDVAQNLTLLRWTATPVEGRWQALGGVRSTGDRMRGANN
jgi:hypothetical protein